MIAQSDTVINNTDVNNPLLNVPNILTDKDPRQTLEYQNEIYAEKARRGCRRDLKNLCVNLLGFHNWDKVHDEFLEWDLKDKSQFKLYLLPRGHLKTSIITIGKTIQDILNDFNTSILIASAVWDNSRKVLDEIKEYLSTKSKLYLLFGQFNTPSARWNRDEIVISQRTKPNKSPTIDTAGIEKTLTMQHYKIIRADDLVTRENITTQDQIEKVKNYLKDLLKLLEPGGRLEVIGTRWHDADLYGWIIKTLS